MTLSDDLNAAADYIEKNGWVQGELCDISTGAACAHGSIMEVTQGLAALHIGDSLDRSIEAVQRLENGARALTIHISSHIAQWNDNPMRTKEEVIQALRDCAIKNQPDSMWG